MMTDHKYNVKQDNNTGLVGTVRKWISRIKDWMKPDTSDTLFVQILKFVLKCIGLLVLIVLSPVILVVMLFVFVVAL